MATEDGVPLAVNRDLDRGHIIFLAFDPAFDPVAHWPGAGRVLTRLLLRGVATAATGMHGDQSNSIALGAGASSNLSFALQDIPSPARQAVILFIVLAAVCILVLGPATYAVLRRLKRDQLMWFTVPAGGLLCLGATFLMGSVARANTTFVNTIGVVKLSGSSARSPAHFYVGLFAPLRGGDYQLGLKNGYPESLPGSYGLQGARFQEGSPTTIAFPRMDIWSMGMAGIATDVIVHGTVESKLHVTQKGHIAGWVRNSTGLTLLRPSVIAGRSIARLPDLPPGARDRVDVVPAMGPSGYSRGSILVASFNRRYYHQMCHAPNCFDLPHPRGKTSLDRRISEAVTELPVRAAASISGFSSPPGALNQCCR